MPENSAVKPRNVDYSVAKERDFPTKLSSYLAIQSREGQSKADDPCRGRQLSELPREIESRKCDFERSKSPLWELSFLNLEVLHTPQFPRRIYVATSWSNKYKCDGNLLN